jgi:hypothetical protein
MPIIGSGGFPHRKDSNLEDIQCPRVFVPIRCG